MVRPCLAALLAVLVASPAAACGRQEIRDRLQRGPYLQQVTRDSAIVCFQTFVECEGGVRVGAKVTKSPKGTRHAVTLTDLKPATEVTYVVQAGDYSSPPITFRTAPEPDAAVTFAAFGDCRTGNAAHAKLVDLILKQKPEFLLSSGDFVENGTSSEQWDRFFEIEAPLLRSVPLYPSIGNHERNAQEYFDVFVLPGEERWYSGDWGPVHFVSLDTTLPYRKNEKQIAWLKKDLAASKAPFKIVLWHHAPYSASTDVFRQKEGEQLAAIYPPILRDGGVCLTIGGHNHNYQRAEVDGICYVTSAGGGAPLYPIGKGVELKAGKIAYHICRLRAEGKTLAMEAIDQEGNVFDAWSCTRP
ncbi:MAG: metallophosphoesterase [Planctomycetes bacterium]|nr:metallophosphoesterase [Planctomycetota bacterium]